MKAQGESKGGETSAYCSVCKLHSRTAKTAARVYLCIKSKHKVNGESVTCFDMLHRYWRNGTLLPPSERKKKIRAHTTRVAATDEANHNGEGSDDSSHQSKRRRSEKTTS
ncbi:hypothetical protein PF008_g28731 [Phytophthora fragariae]|uniref:PiggyBac transposable element-derived protein 4 C-terminal zinc-ribbon domain-containing protein n=1 Tax=Phytophthora fragariae TaxID=53985 RepID=A0A6G0QAI2_9STRA|nr:hypothetical protein PF008_g28731 [Phytophthora fragariae]